MGKYPPPLVLIAQDKTIEIKKVLMPKRKIASMEAVSHREPIIINIFYIDQFSAWSTGSVSTMAASTAFITELTWPAFKNYSVQYYKP